MNYPVASTQPKLMPHAFEVCADQVRMRGKQIMEAIRREYPDITIILIPGAHEFAEDRIGAGTKVNPELTEEDGMASSTYGLLPAFVDGLLEGAAPEAVIVDGTEDAYSWTYNKRFKTARKEFDAAVTHSSVPERYQSQLKLGFGLMLDWDGVRRWSTKVPYYSNHYMPREFQLALHNALRHTDQYVWIWAEQAIVFAFSGKRPDSPSAMPDEYYQAIAECRDPQSSLLKRDPRGALNTPLPPRASTMAGYSEQETFVASLSETYEYVLDLPRRWRFFVDEEDMGRNALDWDTQAKWIDIGEYFENQGYRFKGTGYYRCEFEIPAELEGKPLFLHFGGIAGNPVYLWLNGLWLPDQSGNHTGAHNSLPGSVWGWQLTDRVRYGETNSIIVSCRNVSMAGAGIFKPYVKLAILKEEK